MAAYLYSDSSVLYYNFMPLLTDMWLESPPQSFSIKRCEALNLASIDTSFLFKLVAILYPSEYICTCILSKRQMSSKNGFVK